MWDGKTGIRRPAEFILPEVWLFFQRSLYLISGAAALYEPYSIVLRDEE
jgi:hypothetical protein